MTQQKVDGAQIDGSTLDLTGTDGTDMVNVANLDANIFTAQQVVQFDFASTTYRAAGNDAGICGMRFTETGGTVGGLIMMAPDASDFGIWCGGATLGDKKIQGSSTSKLLDLTATKMTYDGNDIVQANNAVTWTALQTFTRTANGERAIDVTLNDSEVVLSGDVKLRDWDGAGTAYLAAWSDVSNDVGLTLRTLDTGVVNNAITMTFECATLAMTATDITFDGQSLLSSAYVPLTINTQAGTSYTLVLGDAGKYVRMTSGSANTVTIPTDASVAFDIGTEVIIRQAGAGTTTIAGPGVTINTSNTLVLAAQHDTVSVIKVGTNIWDLTGTTA